MVWYLCMGVLAAFGALCALWACFGFLLPGGAGGAVVCMCRPGGRELALVRRCRWLRELGLLRSPVLLVDCGLEPWEREALAQMGRGVEICGLEELPARLELERNRLG